MPRRKKPTIFEVEDADQYKICERELRRQWLARHPGHSAARGGRPSIESKIFEALESIWPDGSQRRPTLGQLRSQVQSRLKRTPNDPDISKLTLNKHIVQWIRGNKTLEEAPVEMIRRNPKWAAVASSYLRIIQSGPAVLKVLQSPAFKKAFSRQATNRRNNQV
jgi:hypothetical protein